MTEWPILWEFHIKVGFYLKMLLLQHSNSTPV